MWCLLLVIDVSLKTISCPEMGFSSPVAIPKHDVNVHLGEFPIKQILYRPNASYNNPLPLTKIGDFVICLDVAGANTCIHGWHDTSVLGKRVSSECYRLAKDAMKQLWFMTLPETKVLIKI